MAFVKPYVAPADPSSGAESFSVMRSVDVTDGLMTNSPDVPKARNM